MVYVWQQHYGFERYDLSGPKGFPLDMVGWITRNADNPKAVGTTFVTRNSQGYITSMKDNDSSLTACHWRVWWPSNSTEKQESSTDGIRHKTKAEAMRTLEMQFGIDSSDVTEIKWEGNLNNH